MHQGEEVVMKELSTTAARLEEEQIGLLRDGHEDDWTDDEESSKEKSSTIQPSGRRWVKSCMIVLLALCILALIEHWLWKPRRHHDTATQQVRAELRSEDEYILDSDWDFGAAPASREFTWIVEDHQLNPDGVFRPMMLINSTFPGPLIEVNQHDEVVVHVHNQAANATSIHWHGLYQNGTAHMDGTVGITNCPIAPGQSFTYRFNVTGQSGTYWYHSHVSMQASDGLVGPLIIHSRREKELHEIEYKQDRVVLLSDHYYDPSSELLMGYLAPGSENDEPVPPSALINGRNIRNCSSLTDRTCSTQGRSNALFNLDMHSNTRLRVINVGAFAEFSLQIDEHEFSVTEVDGTDVLSQSIHRLNINPAQRYSIVLSPPAEPKTEGYWMRARMLTHCFAYENPELAEEVWGIVRYGASTSEPNGSKESKDNAKPLSKDWPEIIEVECRDLNTTALSPVEVIKAPENVDDFIYFRSSFQIGDWRLSRGFLNESSWRGNATSPVLHNFIDSDPVRSIEAGFDTKNFDKRSQLVYTTQGIRTVDILIQNMDDGNHPFHLHGYKFWVLRQGTGYAPQPDSTPSLYEGVDLANPLRRDTASIEAYGWMLIRFIADNPGVWAFHCHIGWHNEAGLGMVFATRLDALQNIPAEDRDMCKSEGVQKGMGPEDSLWYGKWDDSL
ncbi:hypothetical protein E8E13_005831 [Curvularia kusanoi]|uniref:Multicopper oxidase n=1 Tax=Curvularia kusanoi TaxID=90978 RepID=A0A9P4TC86_CURKU|nr:hypothetical protein E8E13_005831 [Curvularia kusanoi]